MTRCDHRGGSSLADALAAELEALKTEGLYRARSSLESSQGPRVDVAGRRYVSFASNDYLGLAADPRLVEAAREAAGRYGIGAGASHLLYGHGCVHDELEQALAAFVGFPRALLFSTGYMANLGIVTALCGRDDEIFADRLNHASLNDAMVLSRARFRRYPHLDLDRLERDLARSRARRKLVITDAVFSMDGDLTPVPELVDVCERHGAFALLDDAHGFGVLGAHGAGILSHFNARSERVLYMGTLGKAAGVYGAFVAADSAVIDYLVNRARTYVYTTAIPPMLAAVLARSLEIIRSEDWRRRHLSELRRALTEGLGPDGARLLRSPTPIQPFVLGGVDQAMRAAKELEAEGFIVPAIRPPTVPRGSARLRISLSAGHRIADVARLATALRSVGQ
ncbi:MAG: 8-amino-7-oxononanoate synthase [Betaproteobacteria bacterium]|nr:MAG: 8-amino-7-oxononanoate synthase [Betaproteobacteria bacterium]